MGGRERGWGSRRRNRGGRGKKSEKDKNQEKKGEQIKSSHILTELNEKNKNLNGRKGEIKSQISSDIVVVVMQNLSKKIRKSSLQHFH